MSEIPKYPTHAVRGVDNSTGDGDIYYLFAYKHEAVLVSYDTGRNLLEYEGDEILSVWSLSLEHSDEMREALIEPSKENI